MNHDKSRIISIIQVELARLRNDPETNQLVDGDVDEFECHIATKVYEVLESRLMNLKVNKLIQF